MLKSSLALQLVTEIQQYSLDGQLEKLERLGVDHTLANRLSKMDARAVRSVCSSPFFDITVNTSQLENLICYADQEVKLADLIDQLVLNDAPRKMLTKEYGLSGKEYMAIRERHGMGKAPIGRWKIPEVQQHSNQHKRLLTDFDRMFNKDVCLMSSPETCLRLADEYTMTIREILTLWNRFTFDEISTDE